MCIEFMFRIDKDILSYLKDLSKPEYSSSSEIEAYEQKRKIIRIVLLTFFFACVILVAATIFFIIYLPGLYNVTFDIFELITGYFLLNWPLFAVFFVFLIIFTYFYLRS